MCGKPFAPCCLFALLAYTLTLMIEALRPSETYVNFYEATWCNVLEGSTDHSHCSGSLNSSKYFLGVTQVLSLT
jgi:hypothetical protein